MDPFVFISTMDAGPWGGSEELWSLSALRLAAAGHGVRVCVPHFDAPRPRLTELRVAGVDVYSRQPPGFLERSWLRVRRGSRHDPHLSGGDIAWLRSNRAGLVCISQGGIADGLPWMDHCRSEGIPYAVIVQSNAEWLWPDDQQSERMAVAYRSARLCCFVSRRNRELFEDQIGEALPNATVVHNPYGVRYDAGPEWPSSEPHWRLGCVARLDPVAKGQDLLIRVLALPKWTTRNLEVTFYGDGRCGQSLRTLAARFGLSNVAFKGRVSDVERIWAENHALVLPSRYEGTPLALVEAMLCRRTAVVTDVAGNTELIENGASGFVACATSVAALDHALEQAWARREEWRAMGEAARERVCSIVPADPTQAFCERLLEAHDQEP